MQYILLCLTIILLFCTLAPSLDDEVVVPEQTLTGSITDYFSQNPILERHVQALLGNMTDEQLAGQVLMPAWERGVSNSILKDWICKQYISGFMILGVQTTQQNIAEFQKYAKNCGHTTSLAVSIDAEPTLIAWNMRVKKLAPVMVTTASLDTQDTVTKTADMIHAELAKMGVTINFAPVVDSNTNKAIISERSFGGNSEHIRSMASAFNKSAVAHNIIPTIKHFPGHGSAIGDSHKELVSISGSLPELDNFDTHSGNVPLIMIGHIAVRDGKYDTRGLPATLSPVIMQDLLRDELDYKGIIITDAMNMGAVNKLGNTTVRALKAGADIILMPMSTTKAHAEIMQEMQNDPAFKKSIKEKVSRILHLKIAQEWSTRVEKE